MSEIKKDINQYLSLKDLDGEIWKDVVGYENLYSVSNYGRVKSLSKLKIIGNKSPFYTKEKILRDRLTAKGYLSVILYKNGESKGKQRHRLVGEAFIPNPENLPQINHKNEIKTDNNVDNLEWCTNEYNANYGGRPQRIGDMNRNSVYFSKTVCQYDLEGNYIAEYPSISEIAIRINGDESNSGLCSAIKRRGTYKGFRWQYKGLPLVIPKTKRNWIPINQYDINGNLIKEYESISSAKKETKIKSIDDCLSGRQKTAGGFIWKYKTNNND